MSQTLQVHASAVSIAQRGVAFIGPSGAGKSALALQLLSMGAELIADDRVNVARRDDALFLSRPATLPQKIEARGMGLLDVPTKTSPTPLHLIVDLNHVETTRLPSQRQLEWLGISCPLVHNVAHAHFPAAIWTYLYHGSSSLLT
ncbi:HPr kinase/phosphorylase [Roseobacteraceae bacterium S113]